MISCLTYNIEFGNNLTNIERWLQSLPNKNDLLCFQEFPENRISSLMTLFTDHQFVYSPGMIKKGETYGQLTVFNKHMMQCVTSKSISLGRSRLEYLLMRTESIKNALITVFEMNGLVFVIANIHLSCLTLNSERRQQLIKLIQEINEISREVNIPVIIVGDYNYTSLFMQEFLFQFMQKYKFQNVFKEATHKLGFIKQQLDYIFYRNCNIIHSKVLQEHFSDHFPIQFVYSL